MEYGSTYSLNSSPPSNILTSNGLTLAKKVSAAISLVDNTLVGQLPSAKQMRQAVEEMTPAGAKKQVAGAPPTNAMVPASEAHATRVAQQEKLNERIQAAAKLEGIPVKKVSDEQIAEANKRIDQLVAQQPNDVTFTELITQISKKAGTDLAKRAAFTAVLNDPEVKKSGSPTLDPDPDKINEFFQKQANDAQRKALIVAATQQLKNM